MREAKLESFKINVDVIIDRLYQVLWEGKYHALLFTLAFSIIGYFYSNQEDRVYYQSYSIFQVTPNNVENQDKNLSYRSNIADALTLVTPTLINPQKFKEICLSFDLDNSCLRGTEISQTTDTDLQYDISLNGGILKSSSGLLTVKMKHSDKDILHSLAEEYNKKTIDKVRKELSKEVEISLFKKDVTINKHVVKNGKLTIFMFLGIISGYVFSLFLRKKKNGK